MRSAIVRFGPFALDLEDRRLRRDGKPVELSSRYFDALALLVAEPGRLVPKDRFMDEVWRGVPVTDEALTQCIRTLRRQLGDDAARPRFIETVPKHGYRFIAPLDGAVMRPAPDRRGLLARIGGGIAGGGFAGVVGGLFYGVAAASTSDVGAISVLLVVLSLTVLLALVGAAGIAAGIVCGQLAPTHRRWWGIAGGTVGGLLIGAIGKLVGTDAFTLLLGQAPGAVTGAGEGALLGLAAGLGAIALSRVSLRRTVLLAGSAGAVAGLVIARTGGRLLGGTFDLLAREVPGSRLRLDVVGALLGEQGFGPLSRTVTSALEGALFAAALVVGMALAVSDRRGPSA